MNAKKYSSAIKLRKALFHADISVLEVRIDYQRAVTKEDVESYLDYLQWKFSQIAGRAVPKEEITVSAREGELKEESTFFVAQLGCPLYAGLSLVHQRAPYVLPNLIEDLKRYREEHDLQDDEAKLIQYTVNGLEDILKSESS